MALGKRSRNIYDPGSTKPFKVSRSKIDLFRRCPRCFYLDRRLGVGRVPGPPFLINSATDTLLKKEFDSYREIQAPHPLMVEHRINAIPFQHPQLDAWRANFTVSANEAPDANEQCEWCAYRRAAVDEGV